MNKYNTLIETLIECIDDPKLYFRPIDWSETGKAYHIKAGRVLFVDNSLDGFEDFQAHVDLLLCTWQTISENDLIKEQELNNEKRR